MGGRSCERVSEGECNGIGIDRRPWDLDAEYHRQSK